MYEYLLSPVEGASRRIGKWAEYLTLESHLNRSGLCNAPATFQRTMDIVLSGLKWTSCLGYLGDVVVFGKKLMNILRG